MFTCAVLKAVHRRLPSFKPVLSGCGAAADLGPPAGGGHMQAPSWTSLIHKDDSICRIKLTFCL